jgi:hypothetical protein
VIHADPDRPPASLAVGLALVASPPDPVSVSSNTVDPPASSTVEVDRHRPPRLADKLASGAGSVPSSSVTW